FRSVPRNPKGSIATVPFRDSECLLTWQPFRFGASMPSMPRSVGRWALDGLAVGIASPGRPHAWDARARSCPLRARLDASWAVLGDDLGRGMG
ncbi:MAG: hypothetical protein ACO23H_10910, partial [Alphaproteobacteria bacterium]